MVIKLSKSINDTRGIIPFFTVHQLQELQLLVIADHRIFKQNVVNVGYMLKIKHEAKGTNLQYGRRTDYATAVDFVDADNSGLMQSSTIPTKTMGLDAH
jgi:hypothetical protein